MKYITKREYEAHYKESILPALGNDYPARRQAWNDGIDVLCKTGAMRDSARDWAHPKYLYRKGVKA